VLWWFNIVAVGTPHALVLADYSSKKVQAAPLPAALHIDGVNGKSYLV
jgi:hypothetical protein